jgi:hypothetical protein
VDLGLHYSLQNAPGYLVPTNVSVHLITTTATATTTTTTSTTTACLPRMICLITGVGSGLKLDFSLRTQFNITRRLLGRRSQILIVYFLIFNIILIALFMFVQFGFYMSRSAAAVHLRQRI